MTRVTMWMQQWGWLLNFPFLVLAGFMWLNGASLGQVLAESPTAVAEPQAFSSQGTINFQGQLRDSEGEFLEGVYNLRFAIYDAPTGGDKRWPTGADFEQHTAVELQDGLFTTQLGSISEAIQPALFSSLNGQDRYLHVWVCTSAGAGCTTYDDMGRLPIASHAYAQTLALPALLEGSTADARLVQINNAGHGIGLWVYTTGDESEPTGSVGVWGETNGPTGVGIYGHATHPIGTNYGIYGTSPSPSGTGVYGIATANSSGGTTSYGVQGITDSPMGVGVRGVAQSLTGINYGVLGISLSNSGVGVAGSNNTPQENATGIYGQASSFGWAGYFFGRVLVTSNFFATGTKSFLIDHPLDPANQYLYHYSIEAPEPFNLYRGMAVLDENGEAKVTLPAYFEAINVSFSYQLTAVGTAMPNLHISQKIVGNEFAIAGGVPGQEVSWQVMALRNDPWVRDHGFQTEATKSVTERGTYLYPEGYGQPAELSRHRLIWDDKEMGSDE